MGKKIHHHDHDASADPPTLTRMNIKSQGNAKLVDTVLDSLILKLLRNLYEACFCCRGQGSNLRTPSYLDRPVGCLRSLSIVVSYVWTRYVSPTIKSPHHY